MRFDPRPMVKARVELGLTQEEAARAIGVDVRTLRRYESGEVNANGFASNRSSRRGIVARIAAELGVDESELLVDDASRARDEPPAERVGHVLPRPRVFAGRSTLVARVTGFLRGDGDARVLAIVGLGGSGKTALVARSLAALGAVEPLVWSFYDEPRVGPFFEALDRTSALRAIVLDGLEVVQADGRSGRARGEIEDARLRRLLRGAASGERAPRVLVTSRFELAGMEDLEGVETVALGALTEAEAEDVLRGWGVSGDVTRLARLSGGHALSTSMLGSYAKAIFGGDAALVTSLDLADVARTDAFGRRLSAVLDGLASAVGPLERDILACVAIFPRGVSTRSLERLARQGDAGLAGVLPALRASSASAIPRAVGALLRRGLVASCGEDRVTSHPILREHFRGLLGGDPRVVHDAERRALARDVEVNLGSLAERPAVAPRDASALDAYERLFEHTLLAGDLDGAAAILYRSLGGFSHLGLRLGAFDRGLRMARAFACDPGGIPSALDAPRPRMLSRALAPRVRLRVAYEWGLYAAALGDLETALDAYGESNADALESGDTSAFVTGLRAIAYTHRLRGDGDEARRAIDRSLRLSLDAEDTHAAVRGLAFSGVVFADAGDIAAAKGEFERARALGDRPFARRAIWEAEVHAAAGEREAAHALLEHTATACAKIGWRGHEAHARALLGTLRLARRGAADIEAARGDLAASRAWADATGEVEIHRLTLELDAAIARHADDAVAEQRALAALRQVEGRGGLRRLSALVSRAGPPAPEAKHGPAGGGAQRRARDR